MTYIKVVSYLFIYLFIRFSRTNETPKFIISWLILKFEDASETCK